MSILVLLKDSTRPEHDSLEKDLNLLRPDFTIQDYVHVLTRFYGVYKPLEGILKLSPDRQKLPHLEKDLQHFKVDPSQIPIAINLPDLSSPSHIYGLRYVLEGSTLGGQVLTKHFKEIFYISPDSGCFFFSGYGNKTVEMWREFQQELLAFSESDKFCEEVVINSAKDTFQFLHHWLNSTRNL